jgi:hypothetical protein
MRRPADSRAHFPSQNSRSTPRGGGRDDHEADRFEHRGPLRPPLDDRREPAEQEGIELGHPVRVPRPEVVGLPPAGELTVPEAVNDDIGGVATLE